MKPRRGVEGALPHEVAGPTLMLLLSEYYFRQHHQKCMNMMYYIYSRFCRELACHLRCHPFSMSSNSFVLPHLPTGQSILNLQSLSISLLNISPQGVLAFPFLLDRKAVRSNL